MADAGFTMPGVGANYQARARWLRERLQDRYGLADFQAAGIVGNLGFESGLKGINEIAPTVRGSKGGFGWAQWTGPRRRQYESFASQEGLEVTSDEAQYRFLVQELDGPYKHTIEMVKLTRSLRDAVVSVGQTYERPGGTEDEGKQYETTAGDFLPGLEGRYAFAKDAMEWAVREGGTRDRVKIMQRALNGLKLYDGPIDGLWGPKSRVAFDNWLKEVA